MSCSALTLRLPSQRRRSSDVKETLHETPGQDTR
jgi:hypothetical protein